MYTRETPDAPIDNDVSSIRYLSFFVSFAMDVHYTRTHFHTTHCIASDDEDIMSVCLHGYIATLRV